MIEWSLDEWNIRDLHEHSRNPRRISKHDANHLRESIDKFGLCEPVVINRDGTIIGGHQRVRILKSLGHKKVFVYIPSRDLSDREVDQLNIRLNRNSGEWDYDILANAWELEDLLDWGFTEKDLDLNEDVVKEEKEENLKGVVSLKFGDLSNMNAALPLLKDIADDNYAILKVK